MFPLGCSLPILALRQASLGINVRRQHPVICRHPASPLEALVAGVLACTLYLWRAYPCQLKDDGAN